MLSHMYPTVFGNETYFRYELSVISRDFSTLHSVSTFMNKSYFKVDSDSSYYRADVDTPSKFIVIILLIYYVFLFFSLFFA